MKNISIITTHAFVGNNEKRRAQLYSDILNLESNFDVIHQAKKFCDLCSIALRKNQQAESEVFISKTEMDILNPSKLASLLVARVSSIMEETPNFAIDDDVVEFILTQYAPLGLLNGCLLQNASNASNCHEIIASLLEVRPRSW